MVVEMGERCWRRRWKMGSIASVVVIEISDGRPDGLVKLLRAIGVGQVRRTFLPVSVTGMMIVEPEWANLEEGPGGRRCH